MLKIHGYTRITDITIMCAQIRSAYSGKGVLGRTVCMRAQAPCSTHAQNMPVLPIAKHD